MILTKPPTTKGALADAAPHGAAAAAGPAAIPALRLTLVAAAIALRSRGPTTAMVYDWLVGASIWTKKARTSQKSTASQASGRKGMAIKRRLEGMCVNTIVFTRPIRLASLAATHRETAVSTLDPKNIRPSSCGGMPRR